MCLDSLKTKYASVGTLIIRNSYISPSILIEILQINDLTVINTYLKSKDEMQYMHKQTQVFTMKPHTIP